LFPACRQGGLFALPFPGKIGLELNCF